MPDNLRILELVTTADPDLLFLAGARTTDSPKNKKINLGDSIAAKLASVLSSGPISVGGIVTATGFAVSGQTGFLKANNTIDNSVYLDDNLPDGNIYIGNGSGEAVRTPLATLFPGPDQDLLNIISGTTREVPTMTLIKDSGAWYVDIEAMGGGDITVFMGGVEYILDCTTGDGVGGKARSPALTLGTISNPVIQYQWLEIVAGVPTILTGPDVNQSETVALLSVYSLLDDASTLADGSLYYQRFNNASSHPDQYRGLIDEISERVRIIGPQISTGVLGSAVLQDLGGLTSVELSLSAGVIYQLHRQNVAAYPVPNEYYVINDPITPYKKITNLNEITLDANGDSLHVNNTWYNLEFACTVSSENKGLKIYVFLPSGSYTDETSALSDVLKYSGVNVDISKRPGIVRLCQMSLKYSNPTTITNALGGSSVTDKRNEILGSATGGGGVSSSFAAGLDTEIQFNTGNLLATDPAFTYDGAVLKVPSIETTGDLTIKGSDTTDSGSGSLLSGQTAGLTVTLPSGDGSSYIVTATMIGTNCESVKTAIVSSFTTNLIADVSQTGGFDFSAGTVTIARYQNLTAGQYSANNGGKVSLTFNASNVTSGVTYKWSVKRFH